MSELTLHKIEQVRLGFPHSEALNQICDYARRTHDAEQAEAEVARLREAAKELLSAADRAVSSAESAGRWDRFLWPIESRIQLDNACTKARAALQSAPPAQDGGFTLTLRELQNGLNCLSVDNAMDQPDFQLAWDIYEAAKQCTSAPPASEPEKYEHLGDHSAVEPWHRVLMSCDRCKVTWDGCWDNYQCPRCGEGELPWQPDPAPADRPEPSECPDCRGRGVVSDGEGWQICHRCRDVEQAYRPEPKAKCAACEGRGYDPNYNRVFDMFDPESEPHHAKGEPTIHKSAHGGYVWRYCNECGPDVSVDEDGLCTMCGRDAVYFGKRSESEGRPNIDGPKDDGSDLKEWAESGYFTREYSDRPEQAIPLETRSGDDLDRKPVSDLPEPSEALTFEQWWQEQVGDSSSWTTLERLAAKNAWDAALSQPAPAVPDAVRQLPDHFRTVATFIHQTEESACAWLGAATQLERALATYPAGGDSPAVPEGRWGEHTQDVLMDRQWIAGANFGWNCAIADEHDKFNRAIESRIQDRVDAAAPTPTDGEE